MTAIEFALAKGCQSAFVHSRPFDLMSPNVRNGWKTDIHASACFGGTRRCALSQCIRAASAGFSLIRKNPKPALRAPLAQ